MTYIAQKPVRFDKTYAVGEIIPDGIVDPKMEKRLIEWGKISRSTATADTDTSQNQGDTPPQINLLGEPITEELIADFELRFGITPEDGATLDTRRERLMEFINSSPTNGYNNESSEGDGEQPETPKNGTQDAENTQGSNNTPEDTERGTGASSGVQTAQKTTPTPSNGKSSKRR